MKTNQNYAFIMDIAERRKLYNHTIAEDHTTYRISGGVIILLQLIMLINSFFSPDISEPRILYRALYIFLIVATVITILLLERSFKPSKKPIMFYAVSAVYLLCVFIWASGISLLDCRDQRDLATFAYATITCVAIVTPEPWIVTLESVVCTVGLNIIMLAVPGISYQPGILTQSLSVCVLANIVAIMCFNRRLRRFRLECANAEQMKKIQELNDKLKDDAYFDALTGIHNRRYLTERINTELNLGEFSSGVIMLDIDFFKKFNDTYGHQNGDECLKHVGWIFKEFVTENSFAVRYGGEEFLLFYESISEMELADKAEMLRERIEHNPVKLIGGKRINITASIGYANAVNPISLSELIGVADKNLYSAKENGRNRIYPGNTITLTRH